MFLSPQIISENLLKIIILWNRNIFTTLGFLFNLTIYILTKIIRGCSISKVSETDILQRFKRIIFCLFIYLTNTVYVFLLLFKVVKTSKEMVVLTGLGTMMLQGQRAPTV